MKTQETPLHNDLSSEVAEDTNSGVPVAEKLPNVPREELDRELISHYQESQWSRHPRISTLPRMTSLF